MRNVNIQEVENGYVITFHDNKAVELDPYTTIWVASTVDEACSIARELLIHRVGE